MSNALDAGDVRSARCYSPREIAQAAGVSESQVLAALGRGGANRYVPHEEAVPLGRALARLHFSILSAGHRQPRTPALPLAVSSTLHAGVFLVAVLITTLGLSPTRATAAREQPEPMRLVFVALPGPGGGGGGGGLRQKAPPPKAEQEGRRSLSSPLPVREPPRPIEAEQEPAEPEPVEAEPLPVVEAPLAPLPADQQTTAGVLQQVTSPKDSRGPGTDGGVGAGAGVGLGEGDGAGIGEGAGGGTGGGVYRPGSGIEPPRLLHEVRPDYTEAARVGRLEGEVVMEIIVRRDGTVGDLTILRGLGGGLNDRAIQAVRQWRFAPARRRGVPVDVIVEVAVEFRLR
jgi:TonB family protein